MGDSFISEKPHNSLLRKHIAYYYFHNKKEGQPTQFIFYPHIKNGLTIYKNSTTTITDYQAETVPDLSKDYTFLYSGVKLEATKVSITPPFQKIGVAFQPLGINNFIDQNLASLMKQAKDIEFDYFRSSIVPTIEQIHDSTSLNQKIELLDKYFLTQLREFSEHRLIDLVELLLNSNKKYKVKDLATEVNLSRKTLLRLFQKHLNCSVKDYLHIIQFRKAVETYQLSRKKPQLGQVAHMHDYYDQSDFIKHFKKITGFNPKRFFNDIKHIGNEDTFWTFLK